MRALRRFHAHKGSESRTFNRGDAIPDEWVSVIRAQGVVDEPLPHLEGSGEVPRWPEFRELRTVDEILGWAGGADDYEERVGRVNHALDAELSGRGRTTLVRALQAFLPSDVSESSTETADV